MQHLMRRKEVHGGFWWGNLNGRVHSEIMGVDGKVIMKWIIKFGL